MNDLLNISAWQEILISWLSELGGTIAAFLPHLLGAVFLLITGWFVSRLVESASRSLLDRLGFDGVSKRLGIGEMLSAAGIGKTPSAIIGRLLFWTLMLTFLLSAAEILGLSAVTLTIDRLIRFLPNVIGAVLVAVIGVMLAQFAGNLVASGAATANLAFAKQLGKTTKGVIVLMVGVLALEQLGIDTEILTLVITAIVVSAGIGMSWAFAFGSRDIVRGLLAGHYLRRSLVVGDEVEVDGRRGRVVQVGPVETTFTGDSGSWSVPNARLIDSVILR